MYPLSNLLIIDLSRLVPGPFCAHILAEMGATVIKIEDDANADYLKIIPPFNSQGMGVMYYFLNRHKGVLKISIKSKEGNDFLQELLSRADVLVETFRPGVLKKLGLDPKQLLKKNKKLIIASISGYGASGSLSQKAGHDLNYEALSGVLQTNKAPHFLWADLIGGGYYAVSAILASLLKRVQTQKGEHLDISLTQSLFYLNSLRWLESQAGFQNNMLDGTLARYRVYETKDQKQMALAALEDKFWNQWCEWIGKNEWKDKGGEFPDRENALHHEMEQIFKSKNQDDWVLGSQNLDICLTPVL
ncbi:MAG: hypothetical protein ACD_73C00643G0001, partial [uncultured bacterium]